MVVCLAVAVDVGEDDILAARTNTVGDGSLRNPLVQESVLSVKKGRRGHTYKPLIRTRRTWTPIKVGNPFPATIQVDKVYFAISVQIRKSDAFAFAEAGTASHSALVNPQPFSIGQGSAVLPEVYSGRVRVDNQVVVPAVAIEIAESAFC